MKKFLAASLVLAFFIPSLSMAMSLGQAIHIYWRGCHRRYTPQMTERAALHIFAGTRRVPHSALSHLGWYERCLRPVASQPAVRRFDHRQARLWRQRRQVALGYGGWAIPRSIVACESGFRNLPPNSAGASGFYQILGTTWRDWGGPPPYEAYRHSKAEQDRVAGRIWAHLGQEQWVCQA